MTHTRNNKRFIFTLDEESAAQLEELAETYKRSRSAVVRDAVSLMWAAAKANAARKKNARRG